MILDYANKWNTGDTLTVKFLNGTAGLHDRVIEVIKEWEQLANLKFIVNDTGFAHVRVKFNNGKNDSLIGTDALTLGNDIETVSFANIHEGSAEEELRQVVLHEFGHAMGLVHEHFHPDCNIDFNILETKNHFKRLSGFSEADVDRNLLRRYLHNQIRCTEFDENSIMMYNIPSNCTNNGKEYRQGTELSALDLSFMPVLYPVIEDEAEPDVITRDKDLEFSLTSPEEEKIFKLTIDPAEEKRYTFKAESDSNVALSVFRYYDEGEKAGYIDYLKPIDPDSDSIGNIAKIELTEHNTNRTPNIKDYFLRIKIYDSAAVNGVIKIEVL